MTVVYEEAFNWNEWFILVSLAGLSLLVWITPKIFSWAEGTVHYLYGIYTGMFFDHTISVRPWDFYDVNDNSDYQFIDFLGYVMYGPYSYFFIYLYVKLGIKGYMNIVYIIIWTCFSLLMEWAAVKLGMFHYDKGYKMYWSVPAYLLVQSGQIVFYHLLKMRKNDF
jgi:hypothetical protein